MKIVLVSVAGVALSSHFKHIRTHTHTFLALPYSTEKEIDEGLRLGDYPVLPWRSAQEEKPTGHSSDCVVVFYCLYMFHRVGGFEYMYVYI